MQVSQDNLAFLRPYIPGSDGRRSPTSTRSAGYYDADGHYARVQPAGLGVFGLTPSGANNFTFNAQNAADVFDDYGAFGEHEQQHPPPLPGRRDPGRRQQQSVLLAFARRRLPRPAVRCPREPDRLQLGPDGARAMRRVALIVAGLLVGGAADRPARDRLERRRAATYKVRGIFDNGSFVVNGEEVRVAGATVGHGRVGRRLERHTRSPASRAARTPCRARPSSS